MTLENAELLIVVVPEGLAFDMAARQALIARSFVGEAVLKHVLDRYAACRILIAPANRFATGGCTSVETRSVKTAGFVDTWGNAIELKHWLKESIGADRPR